MIMSRTDKPSPHSSPRLTRRSQTPNCCSMSSSTSLQSDIYISQQSSSSSSPSPHPRQSTASSSTGGQQSSLPTAPSMQSINTNIQSNYNSSTNSVNTNSNYASTSSCRTTPRPNSSASSTTSVGVSTAVPSNRMSAPTSGSANAACPPFNKVLNKALSADLNDLHSHIDEIAPPLPPRKSSPNVDSFASNSAVNRLLKPHCSGHSPSVTAASSLSNLAACPTSNSRSSENVTLCDFDVPQSVAPPIPKHSVVTGPPLPLKIGLVNEQLCVSQMALNNSSRLLDLSSDDPDKVIVGPAETISGIIDTRPLESRKPPPIQSSNSLDKDPMRAHHPSESNNVYHLKNNSNPNHMRHQSYPNSLSSTTCPSPPSSSSLTFSNAKPNPPNSQSTKDVASAVVTNTAEGHPAHFPLLYENVTINQKDCGNGVPYENINLEYIATLMSEGYSKENVVAALGISRNNIEMAWDILNEFVTKNGG